MRRFQYYEPQSLEEAIALLQELDGRASVLAGGTDLLVEIKEKIRAPECVVNIKKIPGLDAIQFNEATGLQFGALVTARELETHPVVRTRYPAFAQALSELGSIQVRNRATVAGNLCRASPSADTPPPLIACGAEVRIHGPAGSRTVSLEEFFTGPGKTILEPAELVIEIAVPIPRPHTGQVYIKHGRRKAMELATVGVATALTMEGSRCVQARVVLGAVAPTPVRARQAEGLLEGRLLDEESIQAAALAAQQEARPISDVRASAEYRREMVRVLTARALEQAAARARE